MALAGKDEIVREVPHEAGNSFTFRYLSGPELDQAAETEQKRQLGSLRDMDPDLIERIINRQKDEKGDKREAYDKGTLIEFGVIAWEGPKYSDDCTDEAKRTLDARTRDWAADVVLEMNTRTAGEGKASAEASPLAGSPQT